MKKNKFLATIAAIGLATATLVGVAAPAAATPPITYSICHATEVVGAKNGWLALPPLPAVAIVAGHGNHAGDIIPVIVPDYPTGQNLSTVYTNYDPDLTGAQILAGGCQDTPDPIDVCTNIDGDQAVVPEGYYEDDGECFEVEPDLATASLAFSPATCESGELVNIAGSSISNATWGAVTDPIGTDDYDVTATADSGAEFVGGLTQKNFSGTLDPPLTEGCENEPDLATASLAFIPATCVAGEQVDIANSPISNATWGAVTDPPGPFDFDVTATADSGAEFAGALSLKHFEGDLDPQLGEKDDECLETLGPVQPSVSFTQITCDADGSYTLGSPTLGDADKLTWTVNGVPNIPSGTYFVSTTTLVTVIAVAIPPDVLEFDWLDLHPFPFTVPSGCELKTLALTGTSAPFGTLNAALGVLVLGGAMMLMRRREESLFE